MKINCIGPVSSTGLGNAFMMHSQALSAILSTNIINIKDYKPNEVNNTYYHGNPKLAALVNTTGRNIGYFVCESSKLRDDYKINADRFTDIWTASTYCQKILESELDRKVSVVPHCATRYHYSPVHNTTPIILTSFDGHSRFERKNVISTITAVNKAFDGNCHFVIKCRNLRNSYREWMEQVAGKTKLNIINESLSVEDLDQLYMLADIYISLHCSEGFGLQLLEAMAFGCRVIATNHGGNTDFMTEQNSYPVDFNIEPVTDSFFKGDWAVPNIDHAVDQLKKAHTDSFEINKNAFRTALKFSMNNTIDHTLQAL